MTDAPVPSTAADYSQALLEQIPAITYVALLDDPIRYAYLSPQAGRLLGLPADTLRADPELWTRHIQPDDRERVLAAWAYSRRHLTPFDCEYSLVTSTGQTLWVHDQATVGRDAAGVPQLTGLIRDITRLRQAESSLRRHGTLFRSVVQNMIERVALTDLVTIHDPDGTIRFVSPSAERLLGYQPQHLAGHSAFEFIHPDDQPVAQAAFAAVLQHTNSGKPVEFRLQHADGRWLFVEVVASNFLNLPGMEGIILTSRDITERKWRERELQAIAAMAQALRGVARPAEAYPLILDQIMDLLQAAGAALALREPASDTVVIALGRGQWAPLTGARLALDEGVSGLVITTGQPYCNNDAPHDPRLVWASSLGELKAAAAVPLIAREQILGALWICQAQAITPRQVNLLASIADIAANALQRLSLYEQTERRLQHLTILRAVDLAISGSRDERVTLEIILDQITAQLRIDAAAVLRLKPHQQWLELAASRGFRQRPANPRPIRLGEGLAGTCAAERQVIFRPQLTGEALEPRLAGEGFLAYCGLPLINAGRVLGVLELYQRQPWQFDGEWQEFLEALAIQTAIAISQATLFTDLQRSNSQLTMAYDATIEGWSRALDLRDKETEGHTQRVTDMTLRLAQALGVEDEALVHIRRGALLHDIGKMGVPDHILLKPGRLTDLEWEVIRQHPQFAYDMLAPIAFLRPALAIPYSHHEKWDGTGYPQGLKGEQIPLAARLFAVVDVWDALRSERPYHPAWPEAEVRAHLQKLAGTHFEPRLVETFLGLPE